MAINVGAAFKRTSANPIDESMVLSKAEMLAVDDNLMPVKYLAVCKDDGKLYTYDKNATPSAETGKFSEAGGGNANFDIGTVPLGGAGVYEVNAFLNNSDSESVHSVYSRGANGELPDWFSLQVTSGLGTDNFEVSTRGYTERTAAQAQDNAQTYARLGLAQKQDKLVSGQNIKTINGNDITGAGNVQIRVGVGDEYDLNALPSYNEIAADIASHQLRYIEGNWQVRGISWSDESNTASLWAAYDRQVKTYDFEPTSKDDPLPEPYNITDGYTNAPFMGVISSPYRGVSFTYNSDGFARYELNDDSIKFLQREPNKQTVFEKTYTIGTHIAVNEEKWVGTYKDDSGTTYQVYSKMIFIPALPATAGVEGYPHGITGIKQILQVYGFTTDGFVLNAPRQNIQDNIGIYQVQKAGNIQIEVGKDRSSKAAYVCLVYAKNN